MADLRDDELLALWPVAEPPPGFADRVMASLNPPLRRRRWPLALGGALIAAGVAAVALRPPARIVPAFTERTSLSIGPRAAVVAEAGAQLSWALAQGGLVRVEQSAGEALYRVEPGAPLVVGTPVADVIALGTSFRVEVLPMRKAAVGAALAAAVVVSVYQGAVRVENARGLASASAGQQISASAKAPPRLLQAERGPAAGDLDSVQIQGPAAAAEGLELRVVSAGKPVPGAQVRLYAREAKAYRLVGTAATGDQGLARLPARPGEYFAAARAPGLGPSWLQLSRSPGEPLTRGTLQLFAGARLAGRTVARPAGEPVPLAAITASPAGGAPDEERLHAAADPSGHFELLGLSPGLYRVEAQAPGHARAVLAAVEVPRSGELVLQLAAAAFLEGHVVRADGQPAAAAQVAALSASGFATAVTSGSGAFALEVAPGAHRLRASADGTAAALAQPVLVAAGQTARGLVLKLGPAAALAGWTVTAAAGAPIAGATVSARALAGGEPATTSTGPDGAFTLGELAPGGYDVTASAPGFVEATRAGVTVGSRERFPLRLSLVRAGALSGSVLSPDGRPIANAVVRDDESGREPRAEARTGPDGSYRLAGLSPGRQRFTALREGAAIGAVQFADIPDGRDGHADFTLADEGMLTGLVRDARGGPPLRAAAVSIGLDHGRAGGLPAYARVPVDEAGRYHASVPAGNYGAMAKYADQRFGSSTRAIEVKAGETTTLDLELEDDSDKDITLQIVEPGGAPAALATVVITAQVGAQRLAAVHVADEAGQLKLTPWARVPVTTLEFEAQSGGRSGRATLEKPATSLTLQLGPAAALDGELVGAGEAGFTLELSPAGQSALPRDWPARELLGSRFHLEDLPAVPTQVRVRTRDGRSGSAVALLQAGATAKVEIALQPAARVAGRVVEAESGKPLQGWVRVDREPVSQTDPQGRFALDGVAAGAHVLSAFSGEGREPLERKLSVDPGATADLGDLPLAARKAEPGTIGAQFAGERGEISISWLLAGGPAASAGLHLGEDVLSIDGQPARDSNDAYRLSCGAPGSTLVLEVRRADSTRATVPVLRAP